MWGVSIPALSFYPCIFKVVLIFINLRMDFMHSLGAVQEDNFNSLTPPFLLQDPFLHSLSLTVILEL